MKFEEFGTENEKTMMLLPGTCCDWQTNFGNVLSALSGRYAGFVKIRQQAENWQIA